jgi:hypothetical protein
MPTAVTMSSCVPGPVVSRYLLSAGTDRPAGTATGESLRPDATAASLDAATLDGEIGRQVDGDAAGRAGHGELVAVLVNGEGDRGDVLDRQGAHEWVLSWVWGGVRSGEG